MGYPFVAVGLFIFIFGFMTFTQPFLKMIKLSFDPVGEEIAKKEAGPVFCEDPKGDVPTFQAPADNVVKSGSTDDETLGTPILSGGCGGTEERHRFSASPTTYKLIKKNVPMSKLSTADKKGTTDENFVDQSCHFDTAEKLGFDVPIDKTKFKVFFPEISGEIDMHRGIPSRTRQKDSNLLYFIDYGLVFLLHIDDKGEFVKYQGKNTNGDSQEFYLADIYQDIGSNRPNLPDDAFSCNPNDSKSGSVFEPYQQKSKDQTQLQEQYFIFNASADVINGWGVHCKPAIYLYPKEKQLVNVKVHTKGFLTHVDPPYDSKLGWTIFAEPSGILTIPLTLDAIRYPYLYYESKLPTALVAKPEQGWVVKQIELSGFFQDLLPKLGLNPKESADFIKYWSKTLKDKPYYFVGILDQDLLNNIEPLEITPKPDSVNRVRFYFEGLDFLKEVSEPQLNAIPSTLYPDNFVVSEWGGVVKTDKDSLFVCNQ